MVVRQVVADRWEGGGKGGAYGDVGQAVHALGGVGREGAVDDEAVGRVGGVDVEVGGGEAAEVRGGQAGAVLVHLLLLTDPISKNTG